MFTRTDGKRWIYTCDSCDVEIVRDRESRQKHQFCAKRCAGQFQTKNAQVTKKCVVCDKVFVKRRCFATLTCSRKCGARINPTSQPQQDKRFTRDCSNCGKTNDYCRTRLGATNYFCDRTCYNAFKQRSDVISFVCQGCNAVFESTQARDFCSVECLKGSSTKRYKKQRYVHGLYKRVDGTTVPYDSSWELRRMRELDASNNIKRWSRCSWKIPYVDADGVSHVYKPDFEIEYKDGRQVIEEVKGLLTELDNIKRLAAESFCAEKQYEYRLGVGLDQFEWSVPVIVEEYTNSYGTFGRPAMATAMMNMAKEISKRSTCLRNKVGAVICDVEHTQIYSLGHNGDEPGGANQCDSLTPGACGCLHAESTALMKAKRDLEGCVLYVTVAPCIMCSKSVVMTKIKKVVYLRKYRNEAGLNLLAKHGIEIVHYDTLVESNPRTQYGFVATRLCSDKPG